MCGRYSLAVDLPEVEERFDVDAALDQIWRKRYNIAPSQLAPVIAGEKNARVLKFMRWGLIPSWAQALSGGWGASYKFKSTPPINARLETITEKPTFRTAFTRRRVLVPADGFYEWQVGSDATPASKGKSGSKAKAPYRILLPQGGLFSFAGIWDSWRSPEGELIQSFAIITSEAESEAMRAIHHRVPVILTLEQEETWLDGRCADGSKLRHLLGGHRAKDLKMYEVSPLVNSPSNDVPECLDPAATHGSQDGQQVLDL